MSSDILKRTPPTGRRIPYGDEPSQFGELWLPLPDRARFEPPYAAVIVLHGGYWRVRYGLAYMGHLCQGIAAQGVAAWNVEYRRVGEPGGGWPGIFQDVAVAAHHLVHIAPQYGIDTTRLVALGHSAGGHLAFWLAGLHRVPASSLISGEAVPLAGAISLGGVLDLEEAWQRGLSTHAAGELLGGSPEEVPERYAAASPLRLLPFGVPQVVIHGERDEPVPVALAHRYHAAAVAAGDPVALDVLPGVGHFEPVDPTTDAGAELLARVVAFTMAP